MIKISEALSLFDWSVNNTVQEVKFARFLYFHSVRKKSFKIFGKPK